MNLNRKNEHNTDYLLSVDSVVKSFGGLKAVNDVSLKIAAGSITGLIGPNGAGKTTLFNIISGFMKPDQGKISIDSEEITYLPSYKFVNKGLMRTFQIPASFERMTVLENLMVVPSSQVGENLLFALTYNKKINIQESKIKDKAYEVLDFLEMQHVADNVAGNLSGGQKKLLELGRTMMAEPKIILLDEPGAGVNPTLMKKLAEHIKQLNTLKGYTFCIIEHDMDLISKLCDPVIVMVEGKVLLEGDMESIRSNLDVQKAYLGGI
ncbi:ABC transporter ATP-binding protein [Alphaproteobacteria bacterium]|nr:ABC transporter ATP-binding protein [Alphaproteobacteria bacterium]